MFINKWLVAESFAEIRECQSPTALMLHLDNEPGDVSGLYNILQERPQGSFSILLSTGQASPEKITETYLEKITGIFFQPCYYLDNYRPVLFLTGNSLLSTNFCNKLSQKCKRQGFEVFILDAKDSQEESESNRFAYQLLPPYINYGAIVKNWLSQYLQSQNPSEIHVLLSKTQWRETGMINIEQSLVEQEHYKIASLLYEKQKLIDEYKHELNLKTISEKDAQIYLNIQKEHTSTNVKWYHYEYEILPRWYKKFGQVIKVLMGRRTFRSLFDDNVKKYKH